MVALLCPLSETFSSRTRSKIWWTSFTPSAKPRRTQLPQPNHGSKPLQLRSFALNERHNLVRLGNAKFLFRPAWPVHLDHIDSGRVAKSEVQTRIMRRRIASPRDNISTLPLRAASNEYRSSNGIPWTLRTADQFEFHPMMSIRRHIPQQSRVPI